MPEQNKYDYIDRLVLQYKEGNQEAAEELIEKFRPYLLKFQRIVKDGIIDLYDTDSKRFVAMFINDKDIRSSILNKRYSDDIGISIYETLTYIQILCNSLPEEDMWQELIMILLTMAKRYKKIKDNNFCGYLYNSFKYELYRKVKKLTKDPVAFCSENNIPIDEVSNINKLSFDDFTIMEEELDRDWVLGITCGDVFVELTPLQRQIIKLYYYDGYNDKNIGSMIGLNSYFITKQRNAAEKILRLNGGAVNGEKENN